MAALKVEKEEEEEVFCQEPRTLSWVNKWLKKNVHVLSVFTALVNKCRKKLWFEDAKRTHIESVNRYKFKRVCVSIWWCKMHLKTLNTQQIHCYNGLIHFVYEKQISICERMECPLDFATLIVALSFTINCYSITNDTKWLIHLDFHTFHIVSSVSLSHLSPVYAKCWVPTVFVIKSNSIESFSTLHFSFYFYY